MLKPFLVKTDTRTQVFDCLDCAIIVVDGLLKRNIKARVIDQTTGLTVHPIELCQAVGTIADSNLTLTTVTMEF
jgi:hypothetical protein